MFAPVHSLALRFLVLAIAVMLCLLAGEVAIRTLDGYSLARFELLRTAPPRSPALQSARVRRHMEEIPLAEGVDPEWFSLDPPPLENRGPTPPELRQLSDEIESWRVKREFLQVFNSKFAESVFCGWYREIAFQFPGFAFVYDPPDGSPFPRFRHYPSVTTPLGLVTNRWGWRGPDIEVQKPDDVIRIAFIGASTTVNSHSAPFSYPEFVGHWLNRWAAAAGYEVRFEALNLGRAGIDSRSIAAVVHQELLPVEPDLVVYYEGSNDFRSVRKLVESKASMDSPQAPKTHLESTEEAKHSALLLRLHYSLGGRTSNRAGEPPRPSYRLKWPQDLDEMRPDLARRDLPLTLSTQIRDFDSIRAELDAIGADLVMSSFFWLVSDGLVLDRKRHRRIYDQLNGPYWPLSYRDLRRFIDFQNRVYRRYAETRGLGFIDFAASYPQDPEISNDAVHKTPEGVRLHAWIALQALVPLVRDRLEAGSLPRPDRDALGQHPAFPMEIRRMPITCEENAS